MKTKESNYLTPAMQVIRFVPEDLMATSNLGTTESVVDITDDYLWQ